MSIEDESQFLAIFGVQWTERAYLYRRNYSRRKKRKLKINEENVDGSIIRAIYM